MTAGAELELQQLQITPVDRDLRVGVPRDQRGSSFDREMRDRAGSIARHRSDAVTYPRKEPTRRARGSLSREEIVRAALGIIRLDGVESLSMRRIAERLGCSVASPYAHFENQEEILRLLITDGEKILTSDLKAAQASSGDAYEQLSAIAHAYWNFASANRQLHRLMFSAAGGKLYRRSFPTLPTSYRVFLETIRHGITSGAIPHPRKSYPAIARTMWAWMYGLIVLDLNEMIRHARGADPVAEGIDYFTRMLKNPQQ